MDDLAALIPNSAALALAPPEGGVSAHRPYTSAAAWAYHLMKSSAGFAEWLKTYCHERTAMWDALAEARRVPEWYARSRARAYSEISAPLALCVTLRDNYAFLADSHAELLHRSPDELREQAVGSSISEAWLRSAQESGCTPDAAATQWVHFFDHASGGALEPPRATIGCSMPWFPDVHIDLQRALFLARVAAGAQDETFEGSDAVVQLVGGAADSRKAAFELLKLAGFVHHRDIAELGVCDDGTRVVVYLDDQGQLSTPSIDGGQVYFSAPAPSLELSDGYPARVLLAVSRDARTRQVGACGIALGMFESVRKLRDEIPTMALVVYDIEENHATFDDLKKKASEKDEALWELRLAPAHRWRFALAASCVGATLRDWRTTGEILSARPTDPAARAAWPSFASASPRARRGGARAGPSRRSRTSRGSSGPSTPGSSARLDQCMTYDVVPPRGQRRRALQAQARARARARRPVQRGAPPARAAGPGGGGTTRRAAHCLGVHAHEARRIGVRAADRDGRVHRPRAKDRRVRAAVGLVHPQRFRGRVAHAGPSAAAAATTRAARRSGGTARALREGR